MLVNPEPLADVIFLSLGFPDEYSPKKQILSLISALTYLGFLKFCIYAKDYPQSEHNEYFINRGFFENVSECNSKKDNISTLQ